MKDKTVWRLILVVLLSIFLNSNSLSFAQSTGDEEKPRIKNFGWSLKQPPENIQDSQQVKKEKKDDPGDDVIRVETNLVVNDILVLDKQGRSIKGLSKEDFVVFEDEKPQTVETFSTGDGGDIPRSIVLIMDYSGSMLPFIQTSVEAAKVLVDKLKPKDRMAIVTDDVELLADFTANKELLRQRLDSLKYNALSGRVGKSDQFSALYAVLNEVFDKEDVRPIIIFQTDGDELPKLKGGRPPIGNARNLPMPPLGLIEKPYSFANILTATEKARAAVYTIYPGLQFTGFSEAEQIEKARQDFRKRTELSVQRGIISPSNLITDMGENFYRNYARGAVERQTILAGLAKYTGGWADFLEEPEQANDVYTRILSGINSRYVIGYYPTNEEKDGKRRVVRIEVKNHPEYVVWGRKTYYAPEPED